MQLIIGAVQWWHQSNFYNENIINSPKHHIINNAIQTKDYAF